MRLLWRPMAMVTLLASSASWAAEPNPAMGPPPAWVVPSPIPSPDPGKKSAPLQMLLISSQEKLSPRALENYVEYAAIPQNLAGLQALGNVTFPWNTERTDLLFHRVDIIRGGSVISLLKPDQWLVLRRENNLEKAMLDGVRTVIFPVRGLRVGDTLRVAVTYRTKDQLIATKAEEALPLNLGLAAVRIERRFLVPDGLALRWDIPADFPKPRVTRIGASTEHLWVQSKLEAVSLPNNVPGRLKSPLLHVSSYADWNEVAMELAPIFAKARKPLANSQLFEEADRIAAATRNPGDRMMGALRLSQEQVRYVALLLGEGAYVPEAVDETWDRRFGDCKGKTVLLLALLDRLGIKAEPLLVSHGRDDQLNAKFPSLALFDHVIVRAFVDGKTYYLDSTDYGQRVVDDVAGTPFVHGLPLRAGASLERLTQLSLPAPTREALIVWDRSDGGDEDVPYKATLTLRGTAAAEFRAKLAGSTNAEAIDKSVKDLMPGIDNDKLKITAREPENPDGSFTVAFDGKADMDWSPSRGERQTRFTFSHSTVHWDADFKRDEGPGKDLPIKLVQTPYWERTTETVILPEVGKGFKLDSTPLDQAIAGSSMKRLLTLENGRATMVSDFRQDQREITAAEALAAKDKLDELNSNWAYIVGPKEKKKKRGTD